MPTNCGLGRPGRAGARCPQYLQDSEFKGADYIAGGSGSSMIFGESNNNIIQAHGSIEITDPNGLAAASDSAHRRRPVRRRGDLPVRRLLPRRQGRRVPHRHPVDPLPIDACRSAADQPLCRQLRPELQHHRRNSNSPRDQRDARDGLSFADYGFRVGPDGRHRRRRDRRGRRDELQRGTGVSVLTLSGPPGAVLCKAAPRAAPVRRSSVTDGETYVEGGRGDNTIFADEGQNDIVGGNSNMFSLHAAERARERLEHDLRRSGAELRL